MKRSVTHLPRLRARGECSLSVKTPPEGFRLKRHGQRPTYLFLDHYEISLMVIHNGNPKKGAISLGGIAPPGNFICIKII